MKMLHLAFRSLWRSKRRSLLSSVTVGFGTLAILVAGGFMEYSFFGLRETTIHTDLGHIQIEHPLYEKKSGGEKPLKYGLENSAELIRSIDKNPSVQKTMARLELQGLITAGDYSEVFVGRGIEAEKELPFIASFAPILSGQGIGEDFESKDKDREIMLAEGLAEKLNVKVGDWITLLVTTAQGGLNGMDLKVVGTIKHFIPEYNLRFVMMPLATAKELMRTEKVSRLVVMLRDTKDTDKAVETLKTQLKGLKVVSWFERATFYKSVVNLYKTIFGFLGGIVVVVVILTSFNTLMMTVMERIPEVGTLMSVGVPRSKVMLNFLIEGGFIGFFGALVGMLSTLVVTVLVNLAEIQMPPPPGGTLGYPFKLELVWSHFTLVPLVITLSCIVATYLPARYASRLNISWALRHR